MSLEKDIKQENFRSEYQKALLNILYTHNFLINKMNDVFKKHHITRQQFNVLRILRGQFPKPATINLIKDRMLDKMSDASRIVVRLQKKGLIERSWNPADLRAADITISDKGLDLLQNMERATEDFDKFFAKLTEEDAYTLNNLLDTLRG